MPAYLVAVLAASGCFALLVTLPLLFFVWGRVSTSILWSDVSMIPIVFIIVSVFSSVLAFPFAFGATVLSDRIGWHGWRYWMVAGAVSGVACITIVVVAMHSMFPSVADDGTEVSFLTMWSRIAPLGLAAGTIGGLTFRWCRVRRR